MNNTALYSTVLATIMVSIGVTVLGILAGFLPNVRGTGRDPEALADRVWELAPKERRMVADDLAARAAAAELKPTSDMRQRG